MAVWALIRLWAALGLVYACQAEIFTALATMTKALHIEQQLASHLRAYQIDDHTNKTEIMRIADVYDKHAAEALKDPETFLANPINAYLLVKRFTTELDGVRQLLAGSPESRGAFDVELERHSSQMPDYEDFHGVIDALLRLQDTYEIPPLQFVDGSFTPDRNSPRMTASDCFEIGKVAFDRKDRYHALMWLMEALSSLEREGEKPSVEKWLVLDYLAYTADQQGNPRHALRYCKELLKLQPNLKRMQNNLKWFQSQVDEENAKLKAQRIPIPNEDRLPPIKNERVYVKNTKEFRNYEALCRGEDIMTNPYLDKGECYYTTSGDNPLLLLAPVKVEVMYRNPDIVLFHDVVSDKEIQVIKELSTPNLARAVVNDPKTGKLVTAHYRVSRSAWLRDEHHPIIAAITNRIAAITHLDMETVEDLQVVNYGIGGQYEPHFDHSRTNGTFQFDSYRGNRVATWIFYLSDVAAGGRTVFTEVGVKVPPVKGAAAFWWNLKKNGSGDPDTRHAGCPVLAGSKWVANKWMHIRGQEFMRPCGLNADE